MDQRDGRLMGQATNSPRIVPNAANHKALDFLQLGSPDFHLEAGIDDHNQFHHPVQTRA